VRHSKTALPMTLWVISGVPPDRPCPLRPSKRTCAAVPAIDGPMLNRSLLTPNYPASLSDCLIQTDPLPAADAREIRKPRACRGFQGELMRTSRDQGALNAPILSQSTNHARRRSRKRPGPPGDARQRRQTQRTESLISAAICPSRSPSVNARNAPRG